MSHFNITNQARVGNIAVYTTITSTGEQCGYIFIPLAKESITKLDAILATYSDEDDSYPAELSDFLDVSVHGGITYCEANINFAYPTRISRPGIVLGFDCGHAGDKPNTDLAEELFGWSEDLEYMKQRSTYGTSWHSGEVLEEAINMANQVNKLLEEGNFFPEPHHNNS